MTPAPGPPPAAPSPAAPAPAPRAGFFGRLFGREEVEVPRRVLDDAMLEEIEDLLVASDMGVDTALRVTANLAEGRMGRRLSVPEIKGLLVGRGRADHGGRGAADADLSRRRRRSCWSWA